MKRATKTAGARLFCAILDALKAGPMTRVEIREALGLSKCGIYNAVDDLHSLGLVRCVEMRGRSAVFASGDGPSIPYRSAPARDLAVGFGAVWRAIEAGPISRKELIEVTGRWHGSIVPCLHAMRQFGVVHIAEWERQQGAPMALYALGQRKDAPRPGRLGQSVSGKRWRQSVKARSAQLMALHALAGRAPVLGSLGKGVEA